MFDLPKTASGLRLGRINRRDELILCEEVHFVDGVAAIDTVLRRAAISGRVELGGNIADHFVDVMDEAGDLIETVALDGRSYSALKNRWMRCRIDRSKHYRSVYCSRRQGALP